MVGEQQALDTDGPAAYTGGHMQSEQTLVMPSDMEYGITAHYHHAGLYFVTETGKPAPLSALKRLEKSYCLCLNHTCPAPNTEK